MIADWTVDLGPDSPVIEVPWAGWIDLRPLFQEASHQDDALGLTELALYAELRDPLRILNSSLSLTSKSDVFSIARHEVDPELTESAGEAATAFGLCSYIDCVPTSSTMPDTFAAFELIARNTVATLGNSPCQGAGAEIVLRPARLYGKQKYGWTLYAFGFGANQAHARESWAQVAVHTASALKGSVAAFQAPDGKALCEQRKEW